MFVAGTEALHEPVPLPLDRGHVTGVAGHCAGAHDALAAPDQEPLLQVNVALPVVGAVVSEIVRDEPGDVVGTLAEQLFAPIAQLNVPAEQFGGGGGTVEHEALLGPLQLPELQENVALPVVGAVESVIVCDPPDDAGDVVA